MCIFNLIQGLIQPQPMLTHSQQCPHTRLDTQAVQMLAGPPWSSGMAYTVSLTWHGRLLSSATPTYRLLATGSNCAVWDVCPLANTPG